MTDPIRAFELLEAANPAPTTPVLDRPDATTFLAALEIDERTTPRIPVRPSRRRAWLVAAAAFAVTLLLGVGLWLGSLLAPETEVVEPPTTTTIAPDTTSTTTTSAAPPTTVPTAIDPASQALLDRFEATFNSGDPDAFIALFQAGFNREVVVDSDRRLYSLDYMRDIYLVEVGLNTEIRLECTAFQNVFRCVPSRYDDLHRILGIDATEDYDWNLRFDEEGLVSDWIQSRINMPDIDNYEREVVSVFAPWVRESHPEVGELRPLVAAEWIVSKRDDIVAMVAAFAESRGMTLDI